MPKEIKIFIGLWIILSSALIITACVTDADIDTAEAVEEEKECTYYDYESEDTPHFDSVQIMLKKGYRLCE